MNNLQPYEKHIADELQQLPVPDREEGWKEMRKLLDRDLPEGGSAWSGNRKWWWMGITVAIIIVGLWMNQEFGHNQRSGIDHAIAASTQKSPAGTNPQASANSNHQNEVGKKETGEPGSSSKINSQDDSRTGNTVDKNSDLVINPEKKSQATSIENQKYPTAIDDKKEIDAANGIVKNQPADAGTNSTKNSIGSKNNKANKAVYAGGLLAGASASVGQSKSEGARPINAKADNNEKLTMEKTGAGNNRSVTNDDKLLTFSEVQSTASSGAFFQDPFLVLQDPSAYQPRKAEPGRTDKAFAKQMRKRSLKDDNRKMSKSSMSGEGGEKSSELTFAAGLALPQSFAIAGQQSPSYGVNAASSRVSDYMPVPFFQYHVNSKFFFQTELQFQSPQYTDKLLIYQDQQHNSQTNTMLEKNIFVEKLYYFHIPFNVYFSPAKHFYLGSGLQFSSLLSGVATYQSNRYTSGTLDNSYSKVEGFKDDSVAGKLSSSEWRYQLDANYYLKRFTFGARYNQALSQFVHVQPSPTLPFTEGRNQSFFIYLRYNIWEERKKGSFYSE